MDFNMPGLNGIDATDETLRAIRSVANGEAIFGPGIADRLQRFLATPPALDPSQAFPQLTDREREILHLLAERRTNAEIAAQLFLSQKTVRNYVSASSGWGLTGVQEARIRSGRLGWPAAEAHRVGLVAGDHDEGGGACSRRVGRRHTCDALTSPAAVVSRRCWT